MTPSRRPIPVFLWLLLTALSTALSGSQGEKRGVELAAFFNLSPAAATVSYPNRQLIDLSPDSYTDQELTIAGRTGTGFGGRLSYFFDERWGIRFGIRFGRNILGGDNAPILHHLDYISRQPPDYTPRRYVFDQSYPWGPTEGELRTLAFDLGAAARFALAPGISATLSAGGILARTSGTISPLGSAHYWLGGHSVLFGESYLVFLKIPAQFKPGFQAEIEIQVRIGPGLGLAVNAGYASAGRLDETPVVEKILDGYSLDPIEGEKRDTIISGLVLTSPGLRPPAFRFGLGVFVRFGA
jgi:hypothetical protein